MNSQNKFESTLASVWEEQVSQNCRFFSRFPGNLDKINPLAATASSIRS